MLYNLTTNYFSIVIVMATYKEIENYVRSNFGFVPKTCWIADVKSSFGLTKRIAYN